MNLINIDIIKRILTKYKETRITVKVIMTEYKAINGSEQFSIQTLRTFIRSKLHLRFVKPIYTNFKKKQNRHFIMCHVLLKKMITLMTGNYNIVYIDEASFNNNHKCFKNWINVNVDKYVGYPGRFKSTNIILAVNKSGIIHYKKSYKSNKAPDFLEYFKVLNAKVVADEEKMNANLRRKIVYYMDNATIHCNKVNVAYYQEHGIEVIFGIPYTPEFNVAEYFFTEMKRLYYKRCFKSK